MSGFRMLASWLLAFALIGFFLHVTLHPLSNPAPGYIQLYDAPGENIPFSILAERSGVTLFEPAGRFVTAILELFTALLLLIPFSRRFAAVLSVLITGSAVALHLSPWLGRELALPGGGTDGGAHFLIYVIFLAVSLLLLVVHPGERDRY